MTTGCMETASTAVADRTCLSITVIILTFNEEIHIERCIASVAPLAERIIIVDSFSTDRTIELARKLGADTHERAFKHQAEQFQWALDNCDVSTEWVLRLDADEYLEAPLIEEIFARLPTLPEMITGVDFKRKFYFMGSWIRWGGYYPIVLTRLWRTGLASVEQRWMDEHVVLHQGSSILFGKGDIVDENLHGIGAWLAKHNRYATRQMVDYINLEHRLFEIKADVGLRRHSQVRRKRFLRNTVFGRSPLYIRSFMYYIYRMFFRLGFLDGFPGLVYHTLHGLCYFLLIDAKIDEARQFLRERGQEAFRAHLIGVHKIDLEEVRPADTGSSNAVIEARQPGIQTLKAQVRDHWETDACGTRYGERSDRLEWFREITRRRYELEPYIPEFARFEQARGKSVLEIGVGAGSDFLQWCRHCDHATGIDLTEVGIALTRERLRLEGVAEERYTLCTADAEALPFADNSFDIVYSWGVLHHTPDTAQAFREVLRVLKPGSQMRTMIYHVPSWTAAMLYFIHGLAKGQPTLSLRHAVYWHLESPGTKAYTVCEARELVQAAGYKGVDVATRLGPGDLLLTKPSQKYEQWPFKLAWRFWPRPFIRMMGNRLGLYLLLVGRKPA
ncbi:Glycosyl transferase family 2 [Rhizobiales bacterium GAS191]|nr:Glycosyl transferase family 2 [Rhizobiales bacterium GAS191]